MPIVDANEVGARLGFSPDAGEIAAINYAIVDAIADIEGYLGYGIEVREYTDIGRSFDPVDGYDLTHLPVVSIISVTAELIGGEQTGYATVVYTAGLPVGADRRFDPIKRYLVAAVINAPAVRAIWLTHLTEPERLGEITSLSVEAQAIGFKGATQGGGGEPGKMVPGALPDLKSLQRFQHIPVSRRLSDMSVGAMWPYE